MVLRNMCVFIYFVYHSNIFTRFSPYFTVAFVLALALFILSHFTQASDNWLTIAFQFTPLSRYPLLRNYYNPSLSLELIDLFIPASMHSYHLLYSAATDVIMSLSHYDGQDHLYVNII